MKKNFVILKMFIQLFIKKDTNYKIMNIFKKICLEKNKIQNSIKNNAEYNKLFKNDKQFSI